MNKAIPDLWVEAKLSEVALIDMGQSPKGSATNSTGDGLPLVGGASDLGETFPKALRFTSTPTKVSQEGDIILCVRATIGRTNWADAKYCLGRGVAGLRPILIESNLLKLYLKHIAKDLNEAGTGTTFRQIDKDTLTNWFFPLPPLNEQRRIVSAIEQLTDRSNKARAALADIPKLIEQFRQSVLAAAFRGDLTADWREKNPDIEPASELLERTAIQLGENYQETRLSIDRSDDCLQKSWSWSKLKLVVQNIQAGKNFSCPEISVTKDTVGLAKISAVTWDKFNPQETKTVTDTTKIDPRLFIESGDLLVSRANTLELVGASVVVEEIDYRIMLSDKVWRIHLINTDKNMSTII
jgi:type I restriction enzyme, S subunit